MSSSTFWWETENPNSGTWGLRISNNGAIGIDRWSMRSGKVSIFALVDRSFEEAALHRALLRATGAKSEAALYSELDVVD